MPRREIAPVSKLASTVNDRKSGLSRREKRRCGCPQGFRSAQPAGHGVQNSKSQRFPRCWRASAPLITPATVDTVATERAALEARIASPHDLRPGNPGAAPKSWYRCTPRQNDTSGRTDQIRASRDTSENRPRRFSRVCVVFDAFTEAVDTENGSRPLRRTRCLVSSLGPDSPTHAEKRQTGVLPGSSRCCRAGVLPHRGRGKPAGRPPCPAPLSSDLAGEAADRRGPVARR